MAKKKKDNRPKDVIKFSQYAGGFVVFGALWVLAGTLLLAMPDESEGGRPMGFTILIALVGLAQAIGGIGAVVGVRKRKPYAIWMGIFAALTYMLFVLATMGYGASQGHLQNVQPHGLILLAIVFFCGIMVLRYAGSIELRQYLLQKPDAPDQAD